MIQEQIKTWAEFIHIFLLPLNTIVIGHKQTFSLSGRYWNIGRLGCWFDQFSILCKETFDFTKLLKKIPYLGQFKFFKHVCCTFLMLVAFKSYLNYSFWLKIYPLNRFFFCFGICIISLFLQKLQHPKQAKDNTLYILILILTAKLAWNHLNRNEKNRTLFV